MNQYRPATAADVGRTDVEFSNGGNLWTPPMEFVDYSQVRSPYVFGAERCEWRFARVPILPEECKHDYALGDEWSHCVKCGHVPVHSNDPIHCAVNNDEQKFPRFVEGPRWNQFPGEPNPMRTDLPDNWKEKYLRAVVSVHTIRRKLEAGGLAEAEQAILLDGKLYPVEWVKSGVGVLTQQCEVV